MATVINIQNLPDGECRREYSLRRDEFRLEYGELAPAGDLQVQAQIAKLKDELIFKGEFSVPVRLTCSRCAEEFERELRDDLLFVLQFVPGFAAQADDQNETDDYYVLPEGTLEFDFQPLMRERVILLMEMKPLCRDNCRGLCPECGQNLNLENCHCQRKGIDARWLPLKELTDRS